MNTQNQEKLHGCVNYITQSSNFDDSRCNSIQDQTTTIGLKSLANGILKRNWQGNRTTTAAKNQYNFSALKTAQKLHSDLIIKYGISIQKLREFLDEDWDDYKNNPASLELWADLLFKNSLIRQSKIPNNFTSITHCSSCGDVYVPPALVNDGSVLGCPWCWNRSTGLPIPSFL